MYKSGIESNMKLKYWSSLNLVAVPNPSFFPPTETTSPPLVIMRN